MPKGVMWRQDDLFRALTSTLMPTVRDAEPDLDIIREAVTAPGMVGMPACPLMHGTGCFTQLLLPSAGGSTVTLESRTLDLDERSATMQRDGLNPHQSERQSVGHRWWRTGSSRWVRDN